MLENEYLLRFYIIDKTMPIPKQLSNYDRNYNSKVICLPYNDALEYAEKMNEKCGRNIYTVISEEEYYKMIYKIYDSDAVKKFNEDINKIINGINIEDLLTDEQLNIHNKEMEKMDKNINGFSLPIEIDKDKDYIKKLKIIFYNYINYIKNKKAFEEYIGIADQIEEITQNILDAMKKYYIGDITYACKLIKELLEKYILIENDFFVSELDKSYAFRGIAPFVNLRYNYHDYKEQMNYELSFFKGRIEKVDKREDMIHIPLDKRSVISTQRFSIAGVPCIYLGTTSYVCWIELSKPREDKFNVSAFKFNKEGKRLRILNLVISEGIINGICNIKDENYDVRCNLQKSMLRIWPLVCATSFHIKENNRNFKSEYIISQLIMMSLKELNIDGISYLSKRAKDEFQYPQAINLALPVFETKNLGYGRICNKFELTTPSNFNLYLKLKGKSTTIIESYINHVYHKTEFNANIYYDNENRLYQDTPFARYDNYLVSRSFDKYKK